MNQEEVSAGAGFYSRHNFPSVTTDYSRRANISWQAYHGPLQTEAVLHRRRESSGWGSITAFTSGEWDYFKPNITSFPNIPNNQKLRITWRRSDDKVWLAKYDGFAWSNFSQSVTGVEPHLAARCFSG